MTTFSQRETIKRVRDRLIDLVHEISGLELESASAESMAKAGESMRIFATALDDLAL